MEIAVKSELPQDADFIKEVASVRKPSDALRVVAESVITEAAHDKSSGTIKEIIADATEGETVKDVVEKAEELRDAAVEKVVEVALCATPGGQALTAAMVAKEVAKTVGKEAAKYAVKEITSQAVDATESESLQRVKGKIVNGVVSATEKGLGGVSSRSGESIDRIPTESPYPRIKQASASEVDITKESTADAEVGTVEEREREVVESEENPSVADVESNTVADDAVENTERKNRTNDALEGENDIIETTGKGEPLKAELGSETKDALPPNATVEIDGRKWETDDNGKIYAVDGKLMPNIEYSLNEFEYRTDEHGRIVHAEGDVKLTDKARDPMPEMSSKDKKDTDDKGHVIGHQIGGLEKIGNLVPQDFNLNRGEYKKLENELARLAKDGYDVKVEVSLKYKDGLDRPDTFRVKYTVDGKTYVKVFKNESSKNGGNQ